MTSAVAAPPEGDLWGDVGSLRSRFSFRFSASGRSASAFVAMPDKTLALEWWSLDPVATACELLSEPRFRVPFTKGDRSPVDALPFDDGYALVLSREGGRQRVEGLDRASPRPVAKEIGVIDHPHAALLPDPDGRRRALALSRDQRGDSALWEVDGQRGALRLLARFEGLSPAGLRGVIPGVGWLGPQTCAFSIEVDGRTRCAVADVSTGDLTPVPSVGADSDDHVLLTASRGQRLIVASDARGHHELVDIPEAGHGRPRFLEEAEEIKGTVTPLAVDPEGSRLLLRSQVGMATDVHVVDLDRGGIATLGKPSGHVGGPAVWRERDGGWPISCLSMGPTAPFRVLRLDPDQPDRWDSVDDGTAGARAGRWVDARLEELPGPAGPIEALVYGEESWRDAEHVLIALHGGPERSWLMRLEPTFQHLAQAGVTVVAPNQRGSTGYGEAHQRAIQDRWGGPDLEDIRALSRHIRTARDRGPDDRLLLLGRSYGAFLALLAACCEPDAWSRVAVIAPFLSGKRLYEEASQEVRDMLDRLGARVDIDDEIGPRDVIALLGGLRARLLVLHGTDDGTVPVSQSRALRDHLSRLRREGEDFAYLEVPGAGHGVIDGSARLHDKLSGFLVDGRLPSPLVSSAVADGEGG